MTPYPDGTATCAWFLESQAHGRIGNLTAHWRRIDDEDDDEGGFFLTSASAHNPAAVLDLCEP